MLGQHPEVQTPILKSAMACRVRHRECVSLKAPNYVQLERFREDPQEVMLILITRSPNICSCLTRDISSIIIQNRRRLP